MMILCWSASGLSVWWLPYRERRLSLQQWSCFWKHGLFSDVKILATKIEGDQIWLGSSWSSVRASRKSITTDQERRASEDLEAKLGLKKGFLRDAERYGPCQASWSRSSSMAKALRTWMSRSSKRTDPAIVWGDRISISIRMKKTRSIVSILRVTKNWPPGSWRRRWRRRTRSSVAERLETSIMEMFSTKKFTTEEYENDKKNIPI